MVDGHVPHLRFIILVLVDEDLVELCVRLAGEAAVASTSASDLMELRMDCYSAAAFA